MFEIGKNNGCLASSLKSLLDIELISRVTIRLKSHVMFQLQGGDEGGLVCNRYIRLIFFPQMLPYERELTTKASYLHCHCI